MPFYDSDNESDYGCEDCQMSKGCMCRILRNCDNDTESESEYCSNNDDDDYGYDIYDNSYEDYDDYEDHYDNILYWNSLYSVDDDLDEILRYRQRLFCNNYICTENEVEENKQENKKEIKILNANNYLCTYYSTNFENSSLPQVLDEIKEKTKNMNNKDKKKYFNKIIKDYVYDLPTGENINDFYNIVLYNFFN